MKYNNSFLSSIQQAFLGNWGDMDETLRCAALLQLLEHVTSDYSTNQVLKLMEIFTKYHQLITKEVRHHKLLYSRC